MNRREQIDHILAEVDGLEGSGWAHRALRGCLEEIRDGWLTSTAEVRVARVSVGPGDGWDASETGLVLILSGFDRFALRLPWTAEHVQHILRRQGRYAALFGNRLLTILS